MWIQAYAQPGIYYFFTAIVCSQVAGFVFIKIAQFDSAFDLKALDTKASKGEVMRRECFNPKCLGWRFGTDILVALETRMTSKASWAKSKLGDAVAILFAGTVTIVIMVWSAYLQTSFHQKIFEVYWYFYVSTSWARRHATPLSSTHPPPRDIPQISNRSRAFSLSPTRPLARSWDSHAPPDEREDR